jgi:four helix bundle protein
MGKKTFNLEERVIDYAVSIIKLVDKLPKSYAGQHLGGQLLRSGTSPSLHYGEAKAAESKNDFIHKMKVCLKELRESFICLKIIERSKLIKIEELLNEILTETNELISIFVKSIDTASKSKPQ